MIQHITHALRSVQTGDTSISPNISVLSHQKSTATNSLFLAAGEGAAPAVLMCWARRGAAQQGFPRSLQRCIYRSLIPAPSPRSGMPTLPAQPWSAQLLLQHRTPRNGFISLLAYLLPGFLHQDGFPLHMFLLQRINGWRKQEIYAVLRETAFSGHVFRFKHHSSSLPVGELACSLATQPKNEKPQAHRQVTAWWQGIVCWPPCHGCVHPCC